MMRGRVRKHLVVKALKRKELNIKKAKRSDKSSSESSDENIPGLVFILDYKTPELNMKFDTFAHSSQLDIFNALETWKSGCDERHGKVKTRVDLNSPRMFIFQTIILSNEAH
jgi:hypothetical protein